ncbi:hypothetical protein D3C73_707740 [compost metagenome]
MLPANTLSASVIAASPLWRHYTPEMSEMEGDEFRAALAGLHAVITAPVHCTGNWDDHTARQRARIFGTLHLI